MFFTTCKKYSENGFGQRVNPHKCLPGIWKFDRYYVNGADSTIQQLQIYNSNYNDPNSITLSISGSSNKNKYHGLLEGINKNFISSGCSCTIVLNSLDVDIELHNKNKELYLETPNNVPFFFDYIENSGYWRIMKLTKNELRIENTLSKKFRMEFKK